MRMKQVIRGLNNSQKIRVIVNGVGFNTTVLGMTEMCFTDQRIAVWLALERIAMEKLQGFLATGSSFKKMSFNGVFSAHLFTERHTNN